MLRNTWVRIAPHLIDSSLLISGLAMLAIGYAWHLPQWLSIKLMLLIAYIICGWLAMHKNQLRIPAAALALACLTAIIWLATNKPNIAL